MMKPQVLTDPAIFPTEKVLSGHLGKAGPAFRALFDFNHENFPEFVERWKYYNDGKSWLMNVSRKKKTLFWLSVQDGAFRTTFYLSGKYARNVERSNIPVSLKDQYRASAGKAFRGITLVISSNRHLAAYKNLLAVKMDSM
jgi:hypothetical protein